MSRLSLLGSTGSIGQNTLRIVEQFPDRFSVLALAAHSNVDLLARQIRQFQPEVAVVATPESALQLQKSLPRDIRTEVLAGPEGYRIAASLPAVDTTVVAVVGAAGLKPTLAAIDAGKRIALANKETLVMAGERVMARSAGRGVEILPVDSEHSAIFQCLEGQRKDALCQILLTASGGPFLNSPPEAFKAITPESALKHPNWEMGPKITIDSATLMNKGLEVIEAKHLFEVDAGMIRVLIHPQSIIHSMVAFHDGSVLAQLGIPDMKGAIAYALSYPERLALGQPVPPFETMKGLTFEDPDLDRFPCLGLAMAACESGGVLPAVLNAANESAVYAFLNGRLSFTGIAEVVERVMSRFDAAGNPSIEEIVDADARAREFARQEIGDIGK